MKRSINFFRIKLILVIAIIVFPIVLIILLCNTLSWHDFGDYNPSIKYENAPENTAYVDILVRLPESSEDYVDFAEWESYPLRIVGYHDPVTEAVIDENGNVTSRTRVEPILEAISITPDSEIAKLNADGYVSLSVHYAGSKGVLRLDHYGSEITTIKKRYGSFKAAYVDENGNVLGITKASRTRYNPKKPSSFSADGDTLIFTKWDGSPLQYFLIYALSLGEQLAIIALIVCTALDKQQKKRSEERG
ncbi:MAG: hypothetical protein K2J77_06530 [Oscillospiraceae bacterium]|nr:hypothetical protein [Oscillospiraceae bacterium]